ncbi:TOMM precursor leader peptide-binding protein [Streptomyces sp. NPDC059037]|uniref:TOMM precursor leader peptide-binding protein n=1 Tax=Streptomyces sp. NPDC059037 TaxID=3346710 RepID=UPI00369CD1FB
MTVAGGHERTTTITDTTVRVEFKSHLHPAVVPGEAAYLVSHHGITALHGPHAEILVPLLDGTRTPEAIARAAHPALTGDEVASALRLLTDAGLLRFRPSDRRTTHSERVSEAYWDLAGLDGAHAADEVARATVRISALDATALRPVRQACLDTGLHVTEVESAADFTIVLVDDYLDPALREVDALHRAARRPWMPARLRGPEPWIGPIFRPAEGPCWNCVATRLRGHRTTELPVQRSLGLDRPLTRPDASLAAGRALAAHTAVLETVKWLAGARRPEQSSILTLDTLTFQSTWHPTTRQPQCAVCGNPQIVGERGWSPFVPRSRPKAADGTGGGHRALTAGQMLERHGSLIGPVTGIVKEVRRAEGTPSFAEAYVSGQNLAMESGSLAQMRAGLRSLSGGKGLTATEAKVSALCEAVERYSGTRRGDEPVVRDSYRSLGPQALHPNACQLYHDRQFRDRDRWNAECSPFSYVPERFDETCPVGWTPVWSLASGTHRLLPTSMLYFSPDRLPAHEPTADSNGNAAGSSTEDAVLQGFLELVERDAVALWWYNRTRQPAVDLDSFDEPYIDRLRAGYRRLGREIWALDLTTDLGIPAIVALSRRTDGPTEDIVFGFGAHFDPGVALRRALTEMGQLLPSVHGTHGGPGVYGTDHPGAVAWWRSATVGNQHYLRGADDVAPCTPRSWVYTHRTDLRDDLTAVTELLTGRGLDLLVLDQTQPDIELPVVKVLVPGLRHFWARYAPGRLFDVPVALGRLAEPTPYDELNPVPLFV